MKQKSNKLNVIEEFNVKGMICSRCLKVLNTELKTAGAKVVEMHLGKVVISYDPKKINKSLIERIIQDNEFEIIWSKESVLSEKIKLWIINYLWNTNQEEKLSSFLQEKLHTNYGSLSKIFSKTFGKTIERYSLLIMIERSKELIENGQMSFSEIAYLMGYQHLSGLSRLFKQETGMSMKEYKNLDINKRIPIDKI